MTKKAIIGMFKEVGAKFELHTKRVINFYDVDNTPEKTNAIKKWLEENKTWHLEYGPNFNQYEMPNGMIINFYTE